MASYLLAIDQGTTSTRAIVFRSDLGVAGQAQRPITQHYPQPGWVEHDPEEIWDSVVATCREAIAAGGIRPAEIAGVGLTNQRETTLLWDRASGRALHRAIVWQDRRTADICARLRQEGGEALLNRRTGLLLDPYFSATKLSWLLDHLDGARQRAERGELAFGTVDSFLLWRLTGGAVHATDATNASRTALYDIHAGRWCPDLCGLFGVPLGLLPEVRDCAARFGETHADGLGARIPILGMAGDQQAALIGQACFEPGMMKATYGTGCFAVLNTGSTAVRSTNRLLTTIGYRLDGQTTYALEGSIFVAGAALQWLRDGLGLIQRADEADALAVRAEEADETVLVPAFTGLGAPHWDADARGMLTGLTRGTGRPEIVRAALESVAFQTWDLLEAMRRDYAGASAPVLRVDGGLVASDWTMQRLADLLDAPVDRPVFLESTALGAAYLAGLAAGVLPGPAEFASLWQRERRFESRMPAPVRARRLALWRAALDKALTRSKP